MNPLDAWGTGTDYESQFENCMTALLDDPASALGVLFVDVRDGYYLSEGYAAAMRRVAERCGKPLCIATNYSMVLHEKLALEMTEAGIPVLDGTREALLAVRHALYFRDFRLAAIPCRLARSHSRTRTRSIYWPNMGLHDGSCVVAIREMRRWKRANAMGYPVVLKTAETAYRA